MQSFFVGIDLGTSAVKVGAFDQQGNAARIVRQSYPSFSPEPGWTEQQPEDWWLAVTSALKQVLASVDPHRVAAVGLSGQCPGHVLMASDGSALGRAITWNDLRATAEAAWLAERVTHQQALDWTGMYTIAEPNQTPSRLLWLRSHRAADWQAAQMILQPKDWIARQLTGRCATDQNSAYGLYHPAMGQYHPDLLQLLGVEASRLPLVLSPTGLVGEVTPKASSITALPIGTPVIIGTIDAWCDIIGCGATSPGQAVDVAGTSEIVALLDRAGERTDYTLPEGYGIFAARLLEDLYWIGGPTQMGGGTLRWWGDGIGQNLSVDALAAEAGAVDPRPDDPLFLPYLSGERSPVWDSRARGAFVGLGRHHNRAHCTRAVYEGVAFAVRDILERTQAATGLAARELFLSGGPSRSTYWSQLKADITGVSTRPMTVTDTGCLGAAILGALGTGHFSNVAQAAAQMVHPATVYKPRPELKSFYNERFFRWRGIYPALRSLYS